MSDQDSKQIHPGNGVTRRPDLGSRPTGSALTPAQLAAALAVVRHHADRLAQRRATTREGSSAEHRERG